MPRFLIACLCLLLAPSVSIAADLSMEDRIRSSVVEALGGAVSAGDVALSSTLKVTDCSSRLLAVAQGTRNVEVRCEDEQGWRIFVPVRIEQIATVVVMARAARAGVPISADQVTIQQRDMVSVAGVAFHDPQQVVGKIPRRGLPPGAVLLDSHLAGSVLLKRGDPVTIQASVAGISVRMEGRAMGSATLGGRVNVENVSTRRIVRGHLTAEGVVQVGR